MGDAGAAGCRRIAQEMGYSGTNSELFRGRDDLLNGCNHFFMKRAVAGHDAGITGQCGAHGEIELISMNISDLTARPL